MHQKPLTSQQSSIGTPIRDPLREARSRIFSAKSANYLVQNCWDVSIVIKPPKLRHILMASEGGQKGILQAITECCFLEDTGEKLFEDTDVDSFLDMEFDDDLRRLFSAVTKSLGVDMNEVDAAAGE